MTSTSPTPPAPPSATRTAARAAWDKLRKRIGWEPESEMLGEPQLFLLLAVIIGLISGWPSSYFGSPSTGRA